MVLVSCAWTVVPLRVVLRRLLMILCDKTIRRLSLDDAGRPWRYPLLYPYAPPTSGNGVVSFGETSAGYDLRLHRKAKIFKNTKCKYIDVRKFKDPEYAHMFDELEADQDGIIWIPAAPSYILGMSVEFIRVPRNLKGRVVGKSTYARAGIIVNTTPLEPGWEGHLTIEIANMAPLPVALFADQGIGQLEFEMLDETPDNTYDTKHSGSAGKYQNQMEVTPPIIK
jgi:dCTP deaminase